jgi:hypothetical protein
MAHLPGRLESETHSFPTMAIVLVRLDFPPAKLSRISPLAFPLPLSLSLSLSLFLSLSHTFSLGRALSRVAVFKIPHRAMVYSAPWRSGEFSLPLPHPTPRIFSSRVIACGAKVQPEGILFHRCGTVTLRTAVNGGHNRTAKQTLAYFRFRSPAR